jgi:hypothetical protein
MAGFRQIKGSRTPADAGVRCPRASGVRDAPRSKAACAALRLRARSPAGVPPRFSPRGLSSRRFSVGPGFPRRNVKLRRAATRHLGHSDAPRAPVVVPAGMMPEPPGCGVYLSARGCRTRSAIREYPPGWRPLTSEIGGVYCSRLCQVKGVENCADETTRSAWRISLSARGTRMIRIEKLSLIQPNAARGEDLIRLPGELIF